METYIVVLLTIDGCGYCDSLKNKLNSENIPFNELDINENPKIWEYIIENFNNEYVPVVLIYDSKENGSLFLPGRDFQSDDELINKIRTILI